MGTKIWKRNAIVATVLLFVCAGIYLNWSYNRDDDVPELTETLEEDLLLDDATLVLSDEVEENLLVETAAEDLGTTTEDYFAQVRLSRQESRDSAVSALQETMAYETGEDDAVVTTASTQLTAMVETALEEAQIESLVIAKGYADCVAFMTDEGISVAVAAPTDGLQTADIAAISDIVTTQSDYALAQLRIIEVN
jgi:stage III sporulation protein AH